MSKVKKNLKNEFGYAWRLTCVAIRKLHQIKDAFRTSLLILNSSRNSGGSIDLPPRNVFMREPDCLNRVHSGGNQVTSLSQQFFANPFHIKCPALKQDATWWWTGYLLRTSDSLAPPIPPTYMLPHKLWVINNHYSNRVLISRGETCVMIKKILMCTFPSNLHKAGHWPEYIGLYSFLPALGWPARDLNTVSAGH